MSSRPQSIPVTSHHAQLLSNGSYVVMLTAAGSGFSRWGDLAVTRWREDPDLRRLGQLRPTERSGQRHGVVARACSLVAATRVRTMRCFPKVVPNFRAATRRSPQSWTSRLRATEMPNYAV